MDFGSHVFLDLRGVFGVGVADDDRLIDGLAGLRKLQRLEVARKALHQLTRAASLDRPDDVDVSLEDSRDQLVED